MTKCIVCGGSIRRCHCDRAKYARDNPVCAKHGYTEAHGFCDCFKKEVESTTQEPLTRKEAMAKWRELMKTPGRGRYITFRDWLLSRLPE